MSRFDELYIFRHASVDDTEAIMDFIKDEWPKKNHILAENKDFFLYEFQNGQLLNFVISVNRKTSQIDGMMGYLLPSGLKEDFDIWTCMWLTRRKGSVPFLGVEVFRRMKDIVQYRYLTGLGTNPETALPLVSGKAKHLVFKMNHYYKLLDCDEYKIAKIESKKTSVRPSTPQLLLEPVHSINDIRACVERVGKQSIPLKDAWYINKRFFQHPVYTYLVWAITDSGKQEGVLVGRVIEVNGRKVLRLVDFMGNQELFDGLYDAFELLINNGRYEYIDFYIYGVDEINMEKAGFALRTEQDRNIIPNYFEPFVQTNVDIYGTSEVSNVRMCKADADQDRPNAI